MPSICMASLRPASAVVEARYRAARLRSRRRATASRADQGPGSPSPTGRPSSRVIGSAPRTAFTATISAAAASSARATSRSATPGTRSSTIARATPATAAARERRGPSLAARRDHDDALRAPSTSQPLASSSRASSAPAVARRLGGEREPQPARDLDARARARARVAEGREHGAPLRAGGAERARARRPGGAGRRRRGSPPAARCRRRRRRRPSRARRARAARRATRALRARARRRRAPGGARGARRSGDVRPGSAPSCSSRAPREGGIVGAHDGDLERQQLAVGPAEPAGAALTRRASGACADRARRSGVRRGPV